MHAITSLGSTARRRSRLPFVVALFALAGALVAAPKPADTAKTSATLTPEGGRIVVDVQGVPPAVPLFFSVAAEQTVRLSSAEIAGELRDHRKDRAFTKPKECGRQQHRHGDAAPAKAGRDG